MRNAGLTALITEDGVTIKTRGTPPPQDLVGNDASELPLWDAMNSPDPRAAASESVSPIKTGTQLKMKEYAVSGGSGRNK